MSNLTPQEIAESLEYQAAHTISMPDKDRAALEQAATYMRKIASGELAEVAHAHWRHYKRSYIIPYDGIDEYQCSNCGSRRSVKSKYCKDCGALMDGKDDSHA